MGRHIAAKAQELVLEIALEERRLSHLVATFASEQERLRRRALEKVRKEAQDTVGKQTDMEGLPAQDPPDSGRVLQSGITPTELLQGQMQNAATVEGLPDSLKGTRVEWYFECRDVLALAQAYPERLAIAPGRREILELFIKRGASDNAPPVVAGLRIFRKVTASTR